MKKLLLIAFAFSSLGAFAELHFTFCNPATKELKIKNFGASAVDISTYRLCSSFEYQTLNQAGVTINSGDFNLSAGEEVYITWSGASSGFTPAQDDMGLYLPSGSFGISANMVDFLQWGAGDQGREDVAVMGGLWTEDFFLSTPGPYYYIGDGLTNGFVQWSLSPPGGDPYTGVRINEVDPDQPSADSGEFIELFGEADASLDGLVVVFFQGNGGDASYAAYDLDGYALDANGFFVIGNSGVAGAELNFPANSLQNGADGIAIYVGAAADWPNGTLATAVGIVDAMVYGTDDPEDTGLLAILTPGQAQLNDVGNSGQSFSRVPDGGDALVTSNYAVQDITPGATNVLPCNGGSVAFSGGGTTLELCLDELSTVDFELTGNAGDGFWYFLTNENDTIVEADISSSYSLLGLGEGVYHVWAVSFTGTLDENTAQEGQPIAEVISDECYASTSNFISITLVDCTLASCDGADIFTEGNLTFISVCADGEGDVFFFTNTSEAVVNYVYILSDFADNIIEVLPSNSYSFSSLIAGQYHITGLSYDGELDVTTTEAGDPVNAVGVTGTCLDFSNYDITVYVTECEVVEGCTEIYISQYLEGSSNNKAIELYNPTPFPVDLEEYDILGYFNGETSQGPVIALSGILAPGDTYVIANSQSNATLLALADVTGGIATFNGDDALVLTHDLVPIDVIGVVGTDPGASWNFGTGSTSDKTLVRKPQVNAPTTNWIQSQGQWLVNVIDDFSNIGAHSALPCTELAFVGFETTALSVEESIGTLTITVQAFNVSNAFDVSIDVTDGTATVVDDYENVFPVVLSFDSENTVQTFNIEIVDDVLLENNEYFTMTLVADGDAAITLNETETITIEPSDQTYPDYTIALVTDDSNSNGLADSLGVFCTIAGVVHGINFNGDGIHFTLIEGAAGIKIFDADQDFDYTVAEGDSVRVKGEVTQFMGMTEFYPDSVTYIDGGHPLELATLLTGPLTEANESHMVRLECVQLTDLSQWTNTESEFYVEVSDGSNAWTMLVDLDTDIYGTDPPTGHFSVTGIGAQFDTTGSPFDEGYNFWPRYLNDIYDEVSASFVALGEIQYGDEGETIEFFNTSQGAENYFWDFGDGTTSDEQFPVKFYTYEFFDDGGISEVTITLIVDNGAGCSDTTSQTVDAVYLGLGELQQNVVRLYPNPAVDELNVTSKNTIDDIRIMDATGRLVMQQNNVQALVKTLNIEMLAPGVYHINVATELGNQVLRFIKK